jgi:transcription elongation factor GreB
MDSPSSAAHFNCEHKAREIPSMRQVPSVFKLQNGLDYKRIGLAIAKSQAPLPEHEIMNKAFTRESDDSPEEPLSIPRSLQLPPGTRNYMTSDGARQMREELDRLVLVETPALARADVLRPENKRQLQQLEQRISYLRECLRTAVPVDGSTQKSDAIRFGASVAVRDRVGAEFTYRIVGIDEIDLNRGYVSWLSPIAKALLNSKVGDRVKFRAPTGEEELQVVRIVYES